MTRALLEKAMQDIVTSFQRLAEQLYQHRTGRTARRNAFQNLEHGSNLWMDETGAGYEKLLDSIALGSVQAPTSEIHKGSHSRGVPTMIYVSAWERLSEAVERVISAAGRSRKETQANICQAITDGAVQIRW